MLFGHRNDKILSHFRATKMYWKIIMLSEKHKEEKKTGRPSYSFVGSKQADL